MDFSMRKILTSMFLLSFLTACATQPTDIVAMPTPTSTYAGLSCNALAAEQNRVVQSVNTLTSAQKKNADNDAIAMGVGMVLFWPALFFLKGDDQATQLAAAKGQYDAIQSVRLQKGC